MRCVNPESVRKSHVCNGTMDYLQGELEQLRKRQNDSEMKTARNIHQLNKEIGELETLIESKIYREASSDPRDEKRH